MDEQLKIRLQRSSSITLAFDGWSLKRARSFVAAIAHWVDQDSFDRLGQLIAFVSEVIQFLENGEEVWAQTAEGLKVIVDGVLDKFKIRSKLSFLIGYNCSVNESMSDLLGSNKAACSSSQPYLGKHSFARCITHIMHLEALQLIKILEESNTISANYMRIIRGLPSDIRSGNLELENWKTECKHVGKKAKKRPVEVLTRWGAYDILLGFCIEYQMPIYNYLRKTKRLRFPLPFGCFSNS